MGQGCNMCGTVKFRGYILHGFNVINDQICPQTYQHQISKEDKIASVVVPSVIGVYTMEIQEQGMLTVQDVFVFLYTSSTIS